METIVTKDLWIWRVFIGIHRSLNDINVVNRSPLMVNYPRGVAPHAEFTVNNQMYHMCYLLADGIYSNWTFFQNTIFELQSEKKNGMRICKSVSERRRTGIGVLQASWRVVRYPSQL